MRNATPSARLRRLFTLSFMVAIVTIAGAAPLATADHRAARRWNATRGMPRATPESVGMSGERLQAATTLLRQFVADRKIIGAVAAVARRGKVVYVEPVGLQSLESKAPMTEASLFRVYSMTKAVTAVGVMMLVEEGKLRALRSRVEISARVQERQGAGRRHWSGAAAVARDQHP